MATQSSANTNFLDQYINDQDQVNIVQQQKQSQSKQSTSDDNKVGDLKFFAFDAEMFPHGMFYKPGTSIMVRPADVGEIQAYSMVDDKNYHDVVLKMNDMLASCVRIKNPDGSMSSYLDLYDGDRFYVIFLIRELTFQKGNTLNIDAKCDCKTKISIEMNRHNFNFFDMDPKLEPFFDKYNRVFKFETISGAKFELKPGKIGIQKVFTQYIIRETNAKNELNMSFLKNIPFTLIDRVDISDEGILKKLNDFESMDKESFLFLNSAVSKMKFGIKDLSKKCSGCGTEVHAPMSFPRGASGIFADDDAFEKFIKK